MPVTPTFDLRSECLPPNKDWSQLTVTLYKRSLDLSAWPDLIAVAELRDASGTILGLVGPMPKGWAGLDGLNRHSVDENEKFPDEGYTSSQKPSSRKVRAWANLVRDTATDYWSGSPVSCSTNAAALKRALNRTFLRDLRARDYAMPREEPGPLATARQSASQVDTTPGRELQIFRDATSAYSDLYLVKKMAATLQPTHRSSVQDIVPYANEDSRVLKQNLSELRKEEARCHKQTTTSRCRWPEAFCDLTSHAARETCAQVASSVRSLENSGIWKELGIFQSQ